MGFNPVKKVRNAALDVSRLATSPQGIGMIIGAALAAPTGGMSMQWGAALGGMAGAAAGGENPQGIAGAGMMGYGLGSAASMAMPTAATAAPMGGQAAPGGVFNASTGASTNMAGNVGTQALMGGQAGPGGVYNGTTGNIHSSVGVEALADRSNAWGTQLQTPPFSESQITPRPDYGLDYRDNVRSLDVSASQISGIPRDVGPMPRGYSLSGIPRDVGPMPRGFPAPDISYATGTESPLIPPTGIETITDGVDKPFWESDYMKYGLGAALVAGMFEDPEYDNFDAGPPRPSVVSEYYADVAEHGVENVPVPTQLQPPPPSQRNNYGSKRSSLGRRRYAQGGEVDSVEALLTPGEFVMTTDAVRGAGGAQRMYALMDKLEQRGRS